MEISLKLLASSKLMWISIWWSSGSVFSTLRLLWIQTQNYRASLKSDLKWCVITWFEKFRCFISIAKWHLNWKWLGNHQKDVIRVDDKPFSHSCSVFQSSNCPSLLQNNEKNVNTFVACSEPIRTECLIKNSIRKPCHIIEKRLTSSCFTVSLSYVCARGGLCLFLIF